MSGAVSNGYGIMPTLIRNIDKLNAESNALTSQASSNITSDSYAGLGDQAGEAISLQPQITATNAWQNNVTQIQTKLSVTQAALTSISSIATSLQTTLLSLRTTPSAGGISAASDNARQQLTELTSLLNTRSGDSYVFAGTASDQPPVTSPDLAVSPLVSGIIGTVAQVGTLGAAATESLTLADASYTNTTSSVFSAQLSPVQAVDAAALVPQVQIGQNENVHAGIVATQGDNPGAQSTGSSIRDLIRSLATLAGLSSVSAAGQGSIDFTTLISDMSSHMATITQGLAGLTASVGSQQDQATSRSNILSDMSDALKSQLDATKSSDPATTRTQQIAVQNQLTASYTLIADMKTLNLAQYI